MQEDAHRHLGGKEEFIHVLLTYIRHKRLDYLLVY